LGHANTVPAGPPGNGAKASGAPSGSAGRYKTGLRSKTPVGANAPTIASTFSPNDLSSALEKARQAHGMGDVELAVNAAETALVVADSLNTPEAQTRLESSRTLINAIFEARLGKLSQRMVVLPPTSHKKLRVSPEQAFLLSRVDGGVTLDEAIDLSPLPRQKTLRLLVSMIRQGLIAAE